jgi:hypothetical protein
MKNYTQEELENAKKSARKHKSLGVSFLQITLGYGYEKASIIYSQLKKEDEFKDYPRNYSFRFSPKPRNFVSSPKLNLAERLFDLFDDETGRESVKLALDKMIKNKSDEVDLVKEVQNKFDTGYARSSANVRTAKMLYKIKIKHKK